MFLPHLVIGLALTAFLTVLNYRGIRLSATFQNWTTFAVIALTLGFVSAGLSHGSATNLQPLFNGPALVSVVLMSANRPVLHDGI